MTNRDVAAALFISLKTVEANLTRIYRKLGIQSRAELGERMTQVIAEGPPDGEVPDFTHTRKPRASACGLVGARSRSAHHERRGT
jgi:regulatory LuxR family protein